MANFKRGRSRRSVKCTICTPLRWRGNSRERRRPSERRQRHARRRAGDLQILRELATE